MPANPARPELTGRLRRQREEVRQLRLRSRGHTETKTFVIGGDIATGMFIPPFYVGVDYDGETPEWKRLHGFRGEIQTGSVTVDWYVNNVYVASHEITSTASEQALDPPLDVADGDAVRISISDGSGTNLAACAVFATEAG